MADFLSAFPGHTVFDMDRLVAGGRIKLIGQLLAAKYARDKIEAEQMEELQEQAGTAKGTVKAPRRKTHWKPNMKEHEKAQWAAEMTASSRHNLAAADDALARDYPELYPERQGK